jgi:serine/threonine-protein kinase
MTEQRLQRVRALFDQALDLPPTQQKAFLDACCPDDPDLRSRVEYLLAYDARLRAAEGAGGLLDSPVVRLSAKETTLPRPSPPAQELQEAADALSAHAFVSQLSPLTDPPATGDRVVLGGPTHEAPTPFPARLGRYDLLEEIGRGGMGCVLRGHDPDLGRDLAVKVLLAHQQHEPAVVSRFTEEAQIAGQLQHPGIVPVYEIGRAADQRPYFTMKLVRGRTLATQLRERSDPRQDLPRFEQVFEQVCQTVAYAHSRGVIHRDLKPSNIMVGAFGEVQVMDWGLAKVLARPESPTSSTRPAQGGQPHPLPLLCLPGRGGEERDTQPGHVMGTPAYMAPEQAAGEVDQLDQRCDVFGLGAILCEILTGQPPYRGAGEFQVLYKAVNADLADAFARLDACGADAELIGLAKSSLAAQAEQRPRDAGVLAAQMAAYRESMATRLRQAELAQAEARARAAEEGKRRRLRRGLAAWVLLTILVVGGGWLWFEWRHAERQGRARQAIEAALGQVPGLRQQGRWPEALAVLTQARSRLDDVDSAGDKSSGLLRQRLEQAEEDVKLARALEQIRLTPATGEGRFDYRGMAESYARVLKQAGLDVLGEEESVAARIRDSAIRPQLVMALDHWAFVADSIGDRRSRTRLLRLARRADPGPQWGDRFREPALWEDRARLRQLAVDTQRRLAGEPAWAGPPTPLLTLLARKLGQQEAQAEPLLRAAQRRNPEDFWLNHALGEALRERKPAEAVGFYRAALATRPAVAAVHCEVARALFRQGQVGEAVLACRKAIELEPAAAWVYHTYLGWGLCINGRADEAIPAYRKAIVLAPKLAVAHAGLARCLQDRGQIDEAMAEYHRAIALDPNDWQAHHQLGMCWQGKGQIDRAMMHFRRALGVDPKLAPSHHHLGMCWQSKDQIDRAMEQYRRAIAVDPEGWPSHVHLGVLLFARGRTQEALAHLIEAARFDQGATTHYHLGVVLQARGRTEEAIEHLRKAAELEPTRAVAHETLARAHVARREWAHAADCYARVLKCGPTDDGNLWFERAAVLLLCGDRTGYARACAHMVERCGKARHLRAYHVARACTLAPDSVREPARPGRLAEAELKANSGAFWSLTQRAALLYRAGAFKEAVPLLEQSLKADTRPGRAVLNWLWLALATQRLGKTEEARRGLVQGAKWLDQYKDGLPAWGAETPGLDLHNWLEAHVLRREAEDGLRTRPAAGEH